MNGNGIGILGGSASDHAVFDKAAYEAAQFGQTAPTTAPSPPTFGHALGMAQNDVNELVHRIRSLSFKLIGSFPESGSDKAAAATPDGLLPAAYAASMQISAAVRMANELLTRIENALPNG